MARRKSSKKPVPRLLRKADIKFKCPICDHPDSVEIFLDSNLDAVEAACSVCSEQYFTQFVHVTDPADVYREWIDECKNAKYP